LEGFGNVPVPGVVEVNANVLSVTVTEVWFVTEVKPDENICFSSF